MSPAPTSASTSSWFVMDLVEKVFQGPLTLDDLRQNLIDGKVFWSDIALCPGKSFAWVRLWEVRELVDLCPPLPSPDLLKHFRNVAFRQNTFVRLPVVLPKTGVMPDPPGLAKKEVQTRVSVPPTAAPSPKAAPSAAPVPTPAAAPAPSQPAPRAPDGPADWHLLIDENEGGPFTLREIEAAFQQGKKSERTYVWRKGMKRWKPIGQVKEFKFLNAGAYGAEFVEDEDEDEDEYELELHRNLRRSFRKSFIASVFRVTENGVRQMIGICGNITVDGLHLLQDTFRVEYPVQSRHLLEIRPLKATKIPPFKVTAVVRWMDPDNHGIGFQFMQISAADQKTLQLYLQTQK